MKVSFYRCSSIKLCRKSKRVSAHNLSIADDPP
jgi:hypothetical protein